MEKGAVWLLIISQLCIWGYVWWKKRRTRKLIQGEPERRGGAQKQSREMKELAEMRKRSLNTPLSEKARPAKMNEVIGQEEGIRALRAAMCGPNPQHVIIYGPPGCGKTCAARLVLEEARRQKDSPFDKNSKFVEVDATCVRFDERAIADPLMGSVHDPIYQGAGALGSAGVPQPKPGAVSRAHCGILFLDEIGELHPVQMNKLLKVLEEPPEGVLFILTAPSEANVMATIRSREISACLVLQAQSQLKALYKDNCDTIIGNCDSSVFLGGKEPTTLKELSAALGKETIDTFNTGESRGREVSHSLNYQKLGKELMSQDELAVMNGGKCILQLRGVRPFLSDKYDITKHPNYKYLSDANPKNAFDIEKFLSTKLKLKPEEEFEVFDAGAAAGSESA